MFPTCSVSAVSGLLREVSLLRILLVDVAVTVSVVVVVQDVM